MKIDNGATFRLKDIDEDLDVGDGASIISISESGVSKIIGDVYCHGTVNFMGNFECSDFSGRHCRIDIGSLNCQDLDIREGELRVQGDITARAIDVDKRLTVLGTTKADEIEVGGALELNTVVGHYISVGGKFRASSDVEVDKIEVGGTVEIRGRINSRELEVGGKATLSGGEISGSIDVGGVFESLAPLKFGDIDVGGVVNLKGLSSGGNVDVGGKFKVEGDIIFRKLDIGGIAEITGSASGEDVDIGGKLSVGAALKLTEDLEVGGVMRVGGKAEARTVEVGGSIHADSLDVDKAEFSGRVRTENGVFARNSVIVSRNSKVEGWIRSLNQIRAESKAELESVAAPKIVLENRVRVANVYAEDLEIEEWAEISGEVLYTKSIRSDERVKFSKQPIKVDTIPEEKSWLLKF